MADHWRTPHTDDDHAEMIVENLREMGRDLVFILFGIMIGGIIGFGVGMGMGMVIS